MRFQTRSHSNKPNELAISAVDSRVDTLDDHDVNGSDMLNEFIINQAARLMQTQSIYCTQLQADGL